MAECSKSEIIPTLIVEDDGLDGGYATGPERHLMSAVLFDGVQAYLSFCLCGVDTSKTKYQEAYFWVHNKDPEYVFSFDNVCDALGVDPNGLRLGLQNFINSNQIEREGNFKRQRRHS